MGEKVSGFLPLPYQCLQALGFALGTEICVCVLVASMLGWQNKEGAVDQSISGILCMWKLRETLGKSLRLAPKSLTGEHIL